MVDPATAMEVDIPYQLSDEDARARLGLLGSYLSNRHGIKVQWLAPDRAHFSGRYLVVRIDGELAVSDGVCRFKGHDPGFLWRGRARAYIEGKLEKYLDPKIDPAQLPTA